jgi:hypothetical protein
MAAVLPPGIGQGFPDDSGSLVILSILSRYPLALALLHGRGSVIWPVEINLASSAEAAWR